MAKKPKRIKVPSMPVLVRRIMAINRDYKIVFEKEFSEWCRPYADYFVAVGKDDPGCKAWHNRACKLAREAVEGPPTFDPNIELAYQAGYEAALNKARFSDNPHQSMLYATSWRDGWTDGMRERGLVTRVN